MTRPTARDIALHTADGVRLFADLWTADDSRVALAFTHGFTGSAADPDVQAICERLADRGVSVLVPDLRGHGRSGGVCTAGVRETADVAAAVTWLRAAGYDHVIAGGWSMGGAAVLRYAALGGTSDAVLSVSAPGHWYERGTPAMRIVHWACETRTGRIACRVLRHTRLDPNGWPDLPDSPVELIGRIPASTPLLIVHGSNDHYFAAEHARLLAAEAAAAELWIEEGMGHAESGTTPQLIDRLASWMTSVTSVGAPSGLPSSDPFGVVCDDGGRD